MASPISSNPAWWCSIRRVSRRRSCRDGLHRRRPHFRSKGYRSRSHHRGDGLAHRRGRHGLRGRPSDLGHRRDSWPFYRDRRFPRHRAPIAKIPLGAVHPADFLSGRSRRPSRGACVLHPWGEFSVSRVQVERDPSHDVGSAHGTSQDALSPEEAIGDDWAPPPKGVVTLRVEVRGAGRSPGSPSA